MEQTNSKVDFFIRKIKELPPYFIKGTVTGVKGLIIECIGLSNLLAIGSRCIIISKNNKQIEAEVVGFQKEITILMPFGSLQGIGVNCDVIFKSKEAKIYPCQGWKGRIINAMGEPIDNKGPLPYGNEPFSLKNKPIPAHNRQRVEHKIDLGVKSINTFLSCCKGQRMGIFAGSGVGKSVLISMLGRYAEADVKVVGLIGERGRELHEFIHEYLGEEGLKNCVIIVATGDEPAVIRRQAAYLTMVVSEFFRDLGQNVLCIIDSVTRFAMAQREIGLSSGEPPSSKGYTPSVFSELPELLERAGPGCAIKGGSITALFSVLVEGGDLDEPVADSVRGILDGHIVLERQIADRGIFPAVNILKSISRTMPGCNTDEENQLIQRAKQYITTYTDMAEMIRLGAYHPGTNKEVDEAIKYYPLIENFLKQGPKEEVSLSNGYKELSKILNNPEIAK